MTKAGCNGDDLSLPLKFGCINNVYGVVCRRSQIHAKCVICVNIKPIWKTAMPTVAASDFSRNFGKYQDEAISVGVINVTSHGRIVGAYLSATELEHFEDLKRRERKVLMIGELDDQVIADIEVAEYGVEAKWAS